MRNPWKLISVNEHNQTVLNTKRFSDLNSIKTSYEECVTERKRLVSLR